MAKMAKNLSSSGSMIGEMDTAGSGIDEHETSLGGAAVLRIQNGGLTTQHDTEKSQESFLVWPITDRNFNLQMGNSFNSI